MTEPLSSGPLTEHDVRTRAEQPPYVDAPPVRCPVRPGDAREPVRMITVRAPLSLFLTLHSEAYRRRTSLNKLCLELLGAGSQEQGVRSQESGVRSRAAAAAQNRGPTLGPRGAWP
jgi:hypothetical protein